MKTNEPFIPSSAEDPVPRAVEHTLLVHKSRPFDKWGVLLRNTLAWRKYDQLRGYTVAKLEQMDRTTAWKKKVVLFWSFMVVSILFFVGVIFISLIETPAVPDGKTLVSPHKRDSTKQYIILNDTDLVNIDKMTESAIRE